MLRHVGIVIPAGPRDDLVDTLDSVLCHVRAPRTIVVVDDSGGRYLGLDDGADVRVVPAPAGAPGGQGGLWVKICHGYRTLLDTAAMDVVIRLDADALMLGPGLADAAAERFAAEPDLGLLGSRRVDSRGQVRDWSWAARAVRRETGPLGWYRPRVRTALRPILARARANGYQDGEHPLGGCYVHSGAAARALAEQGLLDLPALAGSGLGEDMLAAVSTYAAGFRVGEFGRPEHPMALRWKGLPASPQDLLSRGKLVTHSVRSWDDLPEEEIRRIFRDHRRARPDPAPTRH